jgi:hypothetical protein
MINRTCMLYADALRHRSEVKTHLQEAYDAVRKNSKSLWTHRNEINILDVEVEMFAIEAEVAEYEHVLLH